MQIAPLTGVESQLFNVAGQGAQALSQFEPGFLSAARMLTLGQEPLLSLAGTQTQPTQAEQLIGGINPVVLSLGGTRLGPTQQEVAASQSFAQMPGVAQTPIATPPAETQALGLLDTLTGGPIGMSPATQQGINFLEQQYQTRALPALQNQLAQAGLGRSGALEQGVADLRGQLFGAEVPLLQQEIANRAEATRVLAGISQAQSARGDVPTQRLLSALQQSATGQVGLGGQLAGRTEEEISRQIQESLGLTGQLLPLAQFQRTGEQIPIERTLQTALQGATGFEGVLGGQVQSAQQLAQMGALPRDLAQQQNLANLQQNLRQQALLESITTGVMGQLPSAIGQEAVQRGLKGGGFLGLGK